MSLILMPKGGICIGRKKEEGGKGVKGRGVVDTSE
jgi:hypothetical protein